MTYLGVSEPAWVAWTAIGTILLAIATFIALGATIFYSTAERRRAHADQDARLLARARLVLAGNPGSAPAVREDDGYHHQLTFLITNHGDRPILDVQAEAWAASDPLDERARWGVQTEVMLPGAGEPWVLRDIVTDAPTLSLRAWRYRWTDADGRQWCVDQPQQRQPLPFTMQPPRPY